MRTRSGLTPDLLDRETERRTLDALVADLRSGRGCALVVRGEAGDALEVAFALREGSTPDRFLVASRS